jgi:uncharacterized protein YqjF (DUF2071 family)
MQACMSDFPHQILDDTSHRPWPLPAGPWIMTQSWHDLLFAHWPVDARTLQEKLPAGLPLDTFEGQAWVGVVPFRMTNVAPRGVPALPFVSSFLELNVRTYVTLHGKPGVYFFSLDANSAIAVAAARTLFQLPYFTASMHVDIRDGHVVYTSTRETRIDGAAELAVTYRPIGPVQMAQPGTLEYFLTERYCLYTVDSSFRARRLEIHHSPWPLQIAEATFAVNTMADAAGIRLPAQAPLLHFARRQDTVAWPLAGSQ